MRLLREKKVSAVDIYELCQQRLKRVQQLNAYITQIPEDQGLREAQQADKRIQTGEYSKDSASKICQDHLRIKVVIKVLISSLSHLVI